MPAVEYLDCDLTVLDAEPYPGPSAYPGVLDHVGECFLNDAIGRKVHTGREIGLSCVHRERDFQTRLPKLFDETRNICEARLGRKSIARGFRPQHTEQVPELAQRLSSRVFDGFHCPHRSLRVVAGNRLGGPCLDRHQSHPMGDNVVQLAGDAGSLVGNGSKSGCRLFAFPLHGAVLEESHVVAANADPSADVPHPG